jgi:hypothetical protein
MPATAPVVQVCRGAGGNGTRRLSVEAAGAATLDREALICSILSLMLAGGVKRTRGFSTMARKCGANNSLLEAGRAGRAGRADCSFIGQ